MERCGKKEGQWTGEAGPPDEAPTEQGVDGGGVGDLESRRDGKTGSGLLCLLLD